MFLACVEPLGERLAFARHLDLGRLDLVDDTVVACYFFLARLELFGKPGNAAGPGARLDVFGMGSDTRVGLLGELASASRGLFVWSRVTDEVERVYETVVGR